MFFTIREQIKKQSTGEIVYKEMEEKEFLKIPVTGDPIIIDKKTYRIDSVSIGNEFKGKDPNGKLSTGSNENYINVVPAPKNYKNDKIKKLSRRDRYQHEIIENKNGGEYTIDEKGKKVREWDRDGNLILGKPYPSIARAGDGI